MNFIGLKVGYRGKAVVELKRVLATQGAYKGSFNNNFGPLTESFVKTFQVQHLGPDSKYLRPTGVVDADTAWALVNPSGNAQRSFLDPLMPTMTISDSDGKRNAVLETGIKEYRKNIREIPDGSNYGPEIKKYGGQKGWAWCCLFVTYCLWINKVIDFKEPSTYNFLQWAIKNGFMRPLSLAPDLDTWAPGNFLMWQHQTPSGAWTRTGHISMIIAVEVKNGMVTRVNTLGGNEGNRLKFGIRNVWESDDLTAIINPYQDKTLKLQFGIVTASNADKVGTR